MARITSKFFKNGVDNQRSADLIVDLRRPDKYALSIWSPEQKKEALTWICTQEKIFEAFKEKIINSLKTTQQ